MNVNNLSFSKRSHIESLYVNRDTVYLIKDIEGRYALCTISTNDPTETYDYTHPIQMKIYYFDDLEKFDYLYGEAEYRHILIKIEISLTWLQSM